MATKKDDQKVTGEKLKLAVEMKKLELKKEEQMKKIHQRLTSVQKITQAHPTDPGFQLLQEKFDESYEKRKIFTEELLKTRQNCAEIKSKINDFVRQQNMLMIKVKSNMSKGKTK